ncbi:hypothetical protein [Pseudomonas viridiflava]|uniref:hypothetical protein n=1 Tax=Pseudomonas viridiflava TaxID=33069 RepID=UPI0013CF037C|nr:hypothetical protein [Pseudomonas viridiflava]
MHTAKAATEWAALLELKVCPCPDAQVLWHAISIVPCDLKSVRVLGDKPVITFTHQDGQDFSWLNLKPFPHAAPSCEIKLKPSFESRIVVGVNSPHDFQRMRAACL